MLGDAVSYRDGRTQGMDEIVRRVIDEEALYARTGIQKQPFNTIYQLTALREAGELDAAQEMLLLPEYLNYLLTGQRACMSIPTPPPRGCWTRARAIGTGS